MTQYQKIITAMCRQPERWFYPYDFMRPESGDLFVGYKASSRIPELNLKYPGMFESKPEGKYVKHRIRIDSLRQWFDILPKDLRQIVAKELDYYPHIPGNKYN